MGRVMIVRTTERERERVNISDRLTVPIDNMSFNLIYIHVQTVCAVHMDRKLFKESHLDCHYVN